MTHRIIPRSEWGARYPDGFYDRSPRNLERWLHHSVTIAPDLLPPFTDDYAAVRELESIGQSRFRGGISYTFAVTPAGLIFEGHSIDRVGSHTQGHNTAGAGIVLIGNYEKTAPTPEQLAAVTWLLHEGVRKGWWTSPTLTGGHRDTKGTACPGQKAYDLIPDINRGKYLNAAPQEEPDMDANDKAVAKETLQLLKDLHSGKAPLIPISMAKDGETITARAALRDTRLRAGSLMILAAKAMPVTVDVDAAELAEAFGELLKTLPAATAQAVLDGAAARLRS